MIKNQRKLAFLHQSSAPPIDLNWKILTKITNFTISVFDPEALFNLCFWQFLVKLEYFKYIPVQNTSPNTSLNTCYNQKNIWKKILPFFISWHKLLCLQTWEIIIFPVCLIWISPWKHVNIQELVIHSNHWSVEKSQTFIESYWGINN